MPIFYGAAKASKTGMSLTELCRSPLVPVATKQLTSPRSSDLPRHFGQTVRAPVANESAHDLCGSSYGSSPPAMRSGVTPCALSTSAQLRVFTTANSRRTRWSWGTRSILGEPTALHFSVGASCRGQPVPFPASADPHKEHNGTGHSRQTTMRAQEGSRNRLGSATRVLNSGVHHPEI